MNEHLKPDVEIVNSTPERKDMIFFKFAKVVTITCVHCGREKTSKNVAIKYNDWAQTLCNGCYGELLSK